MKMNWKIGFRISVVVWALFMCGVLIFKFDVQNTRAKEPSQKIEKQILVEEIKPKICEIEFEEVTTEPTQEPEPTPFFELTEDERHAITCIIAGEAEGEIYEGKMAVAQCILDNMTYQDKPLSDIQWMFDGWNTKLETKNPEMWAECVSAVSEVFDNGERVSDELLLWFYNRSKMYSSFHEKQKWICKIGNHDFFGLK